MEWGKAKTILIVTFLTLNMLLAYQLWSDEGNPVSVDIESSVEETYALLRARGIRLDIEIPSGTPTLREITIQHLEQYDPNKMILFETPVEDNALVNKAGLSNILEEEIPEEEQYRIDAIVSDASRYVFAQLYNDLPMFDINLVIYSKDGLLYAYSQSLVLVKDRVEEREQRILSAYQAVGFLVENYLPLGSVISDVSLGYHGQSYDSDIQVLAPKWRIVLETGDIYYVHGINGEVEVPQKE